MSIFSLLTFWLLHNLLLRILKLMKDCAIKYLSSGRLVAVRPMKRRKSFLKIQAWIIRGRNLLLKTIESDGELPDF